MHDLENKKLFLPPILFLLFYVLLAKLVENLFLPNDIRGKTSFFPKSCSVNNNRMKEAFKPFPNRKFTKPATFHKRLPK